MAVVEGGKRVGKPIEASYGLCRACRRRVERCVADMPEQWLRLRSTLGESRALVGGGRRPKPGSSTPINLATDALMRTMVEVAHDALDLVGPQMNVGVPALPANPATGVQLSTLSMFAHLVGPNVERLALVEGGVEVANAVVTQHRRAVRQLGEARQRERLHLPCPRCGQQALVREVVDRRWSSDGTPEVVRCLGCREEWSEAEYAWLSRIVISERDEQNVLKWLLAELNWKYNEAQGKLEKLEALAGLGPGDLDGIDAPAVVAMVREILQ